jgi:hypothetical protein
MVINLLIMVELCCSAFSGDYGVVHVEEPLKNVL